ncbi:MAG: hypothetical protein JSV33_10220 [bacterium]|nr:MAG: hypothetical protein JSV33_10220 [bacterium]
MEYAAVGLGERELNHGLKAIDELNETELPMICANLYRDEKRLLPPLIIEHVNGWTVGVFAVLGEEPREIGDFELRDPADEGEKVVAKLQDLGCDLIVLLAHMRRDELLSALPSFKGVHLIIRGHAGTGEQITDNCADTLSGGFEDLPIPVIFAGDRGRVMGKAVLAAGDDGRPGVVHSEVIELDQSIPDDPEVAVLMKEFGREQGVRAREIRLLEFVSRDEVTGKIRERYLGQENCGRCHGALLDDFTLSGHFRAFETLSLRGEDTNPGCVACHTTGFGRFSGYDPKLEEKGGINLRGVQCEACHGQGSLHSRDGSYVKSARESCRACHTRKWSPDFDFNVYWERAAHCGEAHGRPLQKGHQ